MVQSHCHDIELLDVIIHLFENTLSSNHHDRDDFHTGMSLTSSCGCAGLGKSCHCKPKTINFLQ